MVVYPDLSIEGEMRGKRSENVGQSTGARCCRTYHSVIPQVAQALDRKADGRDGAQNASDDY